MFLYVLEERGEWRVERDYKLRMSFSNVPSSFRHLPIVFLFFSFYLFLKLKSNGASPNLKPQTAKRLKPQTAKRLKPQTANGASPNLKPQTAKRLKPQTANVLISLQSY